MNTLLKEKIDSLYQSKDLECWYMVKQPTSFDSICYLVSFLDKYQRENTGENFQEYIDKNIDKLLTEKPELKISKNYRALRVAAFFGLITLPENRYEQSTITESFREIEQLCGGSFENVETYEHVVERQIEKIFVSSTIDEEYEKTRKDYRLYPVALLYKLLLEIGRTTGQYSISMDEYRCLVATTKKYEDYLETLLLIKLLRKEEDNLEEDLEFFKKKFDNRLIQALKQLPTLVIDNKKITIAENCIKTIAEKVFYYENNYPQETIETYPDFLGSRRSLFAPTEEPLREEEDDMDHNPFKPLNYRTNVSTPYAANRIIFGAPGTGKSHELEENRKEVLKNDSIGGYERVTFHPDYTYAQFVGTYKPVTDTRNNITYSFVPGPFMRIYVEALKSGKTDNAEPFILIIEEINRANVAAVFGDIFQLLDRDEFNVSEYPIQTTEDIRRYLAKELGGTANDYLEIKIPNNMLIWATMNSADQGVFPMDTAFKRRWDFSYLNINHDEGKISGKTVVLGKGEHKKTVEWNSFRKEINRALLNKCKVNEDKMLGPFFIGMKDLPEDNIIDPEDFTKLFKNKVIMYLFDDAAKQKRHELFEGCSIKNLYSSICEEFDEKGVDIFCESVRNAFSDTKEED